MGGDAGSSAYSSGPVCPGPAREEVAQGRTFAWSNRSKRWPKRSTSLCIHAPAVGDFLLRGRGDRPFGGRPGMVMTPQPIFEAVKKIKGRRSAKVILMCPGGKLLTQKLAKTLSLNKNLIIICGHYEGVDERIKNYIDEEISVGDYVLTGGEIPAMIITDSVVRLIKGVLPEGAIEDESFSQEKTLEYPHYTKPQIYENQSVPGVLLSGNHAEIKKWRQEQALEKTKKARPDLIKK